MLYHDLALIGFGGVARALAELIRDDADRLEAELGFKLRVVAITDLNFGSLMRADGIDLAEVLALPRDASFANLEGGTAEPQNEHVIRTSTAATVVEATFTNPVTGEPAISHVRWALETGKSVTTTNKGPVALAGAELTALAQQHGVRFAFEGAVMSGTPVLRFADQMLAGLRVTAVEGILNGTSNYILGRREIGLSLEDAIVEAQELGYAEADPTADIGGSDVRLKVAILANQVLGATLTVDDVLTEGITGITEHDLAEAARDGKRWKLIGSAERTDAGGVQAQVRPLALDASHPLAGISGATNAVTFTTDLLGQVTVAGPGAGRVETAYALLSDLIEINRHSTPSPMPIALEDAR